MELYVLDALLRRIAVVERFESLIWTERFNAIGDFELDIQSTAQSRGAFRSGLMLAGDFSSRLMILETTENGVDDDGRAYLKIKGRSIEKILEDRLAQGSMTAHSGDYTWEITDVPAAIARKIFQDICVTGVLSPDDIIPQYAPGSSFPADTIGEPTTVIKQVLEPQSVYQAIKDLCDHYDMGFRLYRNGDTAQLYFNIYMGRDLTTGQSSLPPVIFSPKLDNLHTPEELTTINGYKNVAYVFSPVKTAIVIPENVPPDVIGFERHVLFVAAPEITNVATATAEVQQKGLAELAKYRQLSAFDGEVDKYSAYKYGTHYELGDLIEVKNLDGVTNNMQVTEQIFISDKEGIRSYPTLSLNQFIQPGSWLAWDYNQKWADLDSSMTAWADQI
jgi:Siphovirus ReqiPepy6 Gp37-like protein